jgi:hypothetical protein
MRAGGGGIFFEVKKREVYFFAKLPSRNCSKTESMFFTKLIFDGDIVSHTKKKKKLVSCHVVWCGDELYTACMHVSGGHSWAGPMRGDGRRPRPRTPHADFPPLAVHQTDGR